MIKWIFKIYLKLNGWKFVGDFPHHIKKAVCIVAPHTSNWDFLIGLAARSIYGVNAHYLAKKELFDSPMGFFFRFTGGIAVDRKNPHHLTERIINDSANHGYFYIAITPEGTRKRVTKWKSGFYNIALNSGIPIIPFALDYKTKEIIAGPPFYPTGDYQKDLNYFREFYRNITPKNPENWVADFE
jgi:1-acyl-sn-glycerol-3-phosphate acyltransferase